MLATYRDSLRELNQGDLAILETRFRTRLIELEGKLESSFSKKTLEVQQLQWKLESSLSKKNWDLVEWMLIFFAGYVVVTTTLVFILAGLVRR